MPADFNPEWWRHRRLLWPLAATLAVAGAIAIAWTRSQASRIVVYNETGAPIAALTITACGQSRTFIDIQPRESVRLRLASGGPESDIAIATNGAAMWRGDFLEPRGGHRAILRLRRDGQVSCLASISLWQRLLPRLNSPAP